MRLHHRKSKSKKSSKNAIFEENEGGIDNDGIELECQENLNDSDTSNSVA